MPPLHELGEVQVVVGQADELAAQQRQGHVQLHAPLLRGKHQPGSQVLGEAGTDVAQRFEESTVGGDVQPAQWVVKQAVEQLEGGAGKQASMGVGQQEGER